MVIQECSNPFISSDTAKGEPWFETITTNLEKTDIGIVFITSANQNASWLNFEAGAILNKFSRSGVCPVLIGLKKGDYAGPMKNLQLTEIADKDDMLLLMKTINTRCGKPLAPKVLEAGFDRWWDDFAADVESVTKRQSSTPSPKPRSDGSKIDELLTLTRSLDAKLASMGTDERERPESIARRVSARLKDFESRYGALSGTRKSDGLRGKVVNYHQVGEDVKMLLVRLENGSRAEIRPEDFEIDPF